MKCLTLIAALFPLGPVASLAETIHLGDGTSLEGELGAPVEVSVKTPSGEKRVAFSLLPAELQKQYWRKAAGDAARTVAAEAADADPVPDDDLASLANAVNLETWMQAVESNSFVDNPGKRGAEGAGTAKGLNGIEQNWVSVYSPKDPVGENGNWDAEIARARALEPRAAQFTQKCWLEIFIKAGEAISRRDANGFALLLRELQRNPMTVALAGEKNP